MQLPSREILWMESWRVGALGCGEDAECCPLKWWWGQEVVGRGQWREVQHRSSLLSLGDKTCESEPFV